MSSLVWVFPHLSWLLRSDEISAQFQAIAKALHLWCVAYTEGTCVYLCRSCLKHTWPISRLDVPTWFIVTRCVSLCVSRHQSSDWFRPQQAKSLIISFLRSFEGWSSFIVLLILFILAYINRPCKLYLDHDNNNEWLSLLMLRDLLP